MYIASVMVCRNALFSCVPCVAEDLPIFRSFVRYKVGWDGERERARVWNFGDYAVFCL